MTIALNSPRALFTAIGQAPTGRIGDILKQIDLETLSLLQLYHATLGRLPNAIEIGPDAPAREAALRRVLRGRGFQENIAQRLLHAFPEKRRLLFVHIPKCAGSDLTVNLLERFAGLDWRLARQDWFDQEAFLPAIRDFVRACEESDSIFVHSHVRLRVFAGENLIRPGDEVFTVVRDPADRVISKVNYVLTRFAADPDMKSTANRSWAKHLDAALIERWTRDQDPAPLTRQILATPKVLQAEAMCEFLGGRDAQSAIELCARTNIEITNIQNYERWLLERWGIGTSSRRNTSRKIIRLQDLDQAEKTYIEELGEQDKVLLTRIDDRLAASGAASVRGLDLV